MTLWLKETGVCGLNRGKGLGLCACLRRIGNRPGGSTLDNVARQGIDWILPEEDFAILADASYCEVPGLPAGCTRL
jgi:hypothetical protein